MLGFGAISELPLSTIPEVSTDTHLGSSALSATGSVSGSAVVQISGKSALSASAAVSLVQLSGSKSERSSGSSRREALEVSCLCGFCCNMFRIH